MSTRAKALIRRAIKIIKEEDGASDIGCYRDIITEVLHLANKKFSTGPYSGPDMLHHQLCQLGFETFEEELEIIEANKVNAIPDTDLPLHTLNEFKYDASKIRFEERLKEGKHGKEAAPLHNLRKKNRKGNKIPER